jgi:diguanylate cyclase (GGDEF)-like protein/PAS domain S-box-containing protein
MSYKSFSPREELAGKNERLFQALIENSTEGVVLLDREGLIIYISPTVTEMLGYVPSEFHNRNAFELMHPDDVPRVVSIFKKILTLKPGEIMTAEYRYKHRNGSWRWIEARSNNLLDEEAIGGVVVNYRDVTEQKSAESRAYYHLYYDGLTDLPNRNHFYQQLEARAAAGAADKKMFAVVFLDLDRFKYINESLGHAIGDRLIQEVGMRMRQCIGAEDFLAKMGGDSFGVIINRVDNAEDVGRFCQGVIESLKHPFDLDDHELYVTPSLGVALFPFDGENGSALMRNAEAALYKAKEAGRNNYQFYVPNMNAKTFERLNFENTLRRALSNNEFVVYYQPQIDLGTGRIVQMEALIRWIHPGLGLVMPDEFIELAEVTGLIEQIGEWVLRESVRQVKAWHDAGFGPVRLAVNVCSRQLKQKNFAAILAAILDECGFDPKFLELELTESAIFDNNSNSLNALYELKRQGLTLALDDFNTGYSSLAYINSLPIDVLKIDKTFVEGIPLNEKDTAIANSIINLGHSLNMAVIAEGVENAEQLQFLKQQKCDLVQGYLISRPLDPDQMEKLLTTRAK